MLAIIQVMIMPKYTLLRTPKQPPGIESGLEADPTIGAEIKFGEGRLPDSENGFDVADKIIDPQS